MLQDQKTVEAQYATADRLNRRISIHEKYSVNRQGFGPWIASHYDFHPGQRILELGCGTGDMWRGQLDSLPQGCTLLLTDASEGMLQAAKENLGTRENVSAARAGARTTLVEYGGKLGGMWTLGLLSPFFDNHHHDGLNRELREALQARGCWGGLFPGRTTALRCKTAGVCWSDSFRRWNGWITRTRWR